MSCDASSLFTFTAPTPVEGAVNTIVVQTAQAAASQTAAAMPPTETPTLTAVPTQTPSITPSPTPTFIFLLSTLTSTAPASGGDLACQLTGQNPEDGTIMSKNNRFTASWTVQNTGQATWDPRSVDFVYVSGVKMASVRAADLPKSVAPEKSITLTLTMTAPSTPGKYKTVWTLQQGKNAFCKLSLNIIVK